MQKMYGKIQMVELVCPKCKAKLIIDKNDAIEGNRKRQTVSTERSRTKRGQCQNAIDDVLLSKNKSGGYGTKEYYGTA